jgi:hypothetical protein
MKFCSSFKVMVMVVFFLILFNLSISAQETISKDEMKTTHISQKYMDLGSLGMQGELEGFFYWAEIVGVFRITQYLNYNKASLQEQQLFKGYLKNKNVIIGGVNYPKRYQNLIPAGNAVGAFLPVLEMNNKYLLFLCRSSDTGSTYSILRPKQGSIYLVGENNSYVQLHGYSENEDCSTCAKREIEIQNKRFGDLKHESLLEVFQKCKEIERIDSSIINRRNSLQKGYDKKDEKKKEAKGSKQ